MSYVQSHFVMPEFPVEAILCHRYNARNKPEFKVHWKGYPKEDATWASHRDVVNNQQYLEYRRKLPKEEQDKMQLPRGAKIGDDEDGLCVRRAVAKLDIPDVECTSFRPWMTVEEIVTTLREQGCVVKRLRRRADGRQPCTKGKRLLLIRGTHAHGVHCKYKGYKNPLARNHEVYHVIKPFVRRDQSGCMTNSTCAHDIGDDDPRTG